jgi:hypothetical protein
MKLSIDLHYQQSLSKATKTEIWRHHKDVDKLT